MLCQNCEKNEATTHLKQVINGDTAEQHLCGECARHLGYADMFGGFGLSLSDMFGGLFGDAAQTKALTPTAQRCKKCGFSFQDIVREGQVGCADCYRSFYEKLQPSLQRIHGRVSHNGKVSRAENQAPEETTEMKIEHKKQQLKEAVEQQDFEKAAVLRDEIKELEAEKHA